MGEPQDLADGKLRLDFPAEHVARLTIDNPAKRNALDHPILDAIAETVPSLDARCLLLTAVGPVFSAGYDIGNLSKEEMETKAESLVAHPFSHAVEAIEAYPYPVVAGLNGHTIGGGLETALSCDLRVCADSAKLGMPPAKLGLIYSHTGLRKFIDAIGVARTRQLFFTGRNVDAATGLDWGLVTEVVPAEEVEGRSVALAAEIAANAPISLRGNKRVITELLRAEFRLDPELERELVGLRESCFRTDDFYEGVQAFGEKRKARWQDR